MPDLVPLHPAGGQERGGRADLPPPSSAPTQYEDRTGVIRVEGESDDPYAYTNFNPALVAEERSGDLSRMTWIMTVVAGVVLGAVMTFIAAGG